MENRNAGTFERIKRLTIDMVKKSSVVRCGQEEVEFAKDLQNILLEIPYFQKNPDNVRLVPLENDSFNRYYVSAFLEGKVKCPDTVILLSHFDVVGVSDYGELSKYAFDPEKLKQKMMDIKTNFSEEVQQDIESEDWLFGRGVVDMKSGIAQHIWLLEKISNELDTINGNILFLSLPDEEALAMGAQSSAKHLRKMIEEKNINPVGLIKGDAILPRYKDDPNNYIYFGTIGKYLLSFYICGIAAHAGECMKGLDSNLIASSLVQRMSMNYDFCEEADGEITPPPVTLKQSDLKEVYDVQIPYESHVYFNYFSFTKSPQNVLEIGKKEAKKAVQEMYNNLIKQKKKYYKKADIPYNPEQDDANIFIYDELVKKVVSEKPHLMQEMHDFIEKFPYNESDPAKLSLGIVRKLFRESNEFNEKKPCIIIYLSPPYVPRVQLNEDNVREQYFMKTIKNVVENNISKTQIRRFYPYISDISWFAMNDNVDDIHSLMVNTPGFDKTCSVDLKLLTDLNVPSANIGPYGKDPHQSTERVYMPNAFEHIPNLIYKVVKGLLPSK